MKNKLKFLFLISFVVLAFSSCKDKNSPSIMLEGDVVMEHVLNAPFVEPGYIAMDDKDGDITAKVTVSELDVNTTGVKSIVYTVSDEEGNTDSVVREVTVYNELRDFNAAWKAEYIQPYPGTDKIDYTDSITASTTKNMQIVFQNFANNSNAALTGTVVMNGNDATINFDSQTIGGSSFSSDYAVIEENLSKITIDYTIGSTRGVIVFDKQ